MKNKINLIILFFLFYGCQGPDGHNIVGNQKNILSTDQIEINIITQTLPALIIPRPQLPPPPPPWVDTNSTEYEDHKKVQKDYLIRLDTSQFKIYLHDTLAVISKQNLNNLSDTAFGSFIKLFISDTLMDKSIDISKVGDISPYKLIKEQLTIKQFLENQDFNILGVAQYSRIIFNDTKTEAIFYFSFLCGRLCGSGIFVKVKNKNNKWIITNKYQLWVS